MAWTNLADTFCRLGNSEMASQILDESVEIFHQCGPRSTVQLHRSWVRGLVAREQGRLSESEARFETAQEGYQRLLDPYNEALVSLDLATVYAKQGRNEDPTVLVEATWKGLQSQNLHEEAAQALGLLITAAQQRQLAEELVSAAGEALRKHRIRSRGCSR